MRRILSVLITAVVLLPLAYVIFVATEKDEIQGWDYAIGPLIVDLVLMAVVAIGAFVSSIPVALSNRQSPWHRRLVRYFIDLLTAAAAGLLVLAILNQKGFL